MVIFENKPSTNTPINSANLNENFSETLLKENLKQNLSDNGENSIPSVKAINDILQWKLVGSSIGKTPINLPENFNEIYAVINDGNTDIVQEFIPKNSLKDGYKSSIHGWYRNVNDYGYVYVLRSKTKYALNVYELIGENKISQCTTTIYYR